MDIDFDKICSMIMIYLDERISVEKLTELLSYGKQVSFEKGDLILGIGEKMKKSIFHFAGDSRLPCEGSLRKTFHRNVFYASLCKGLSKTFNFCRTHVIYNADAYYNFQKM